MHVLMCVSYLKKNAYNVTAEDVATFKWRSSLGFFFQIKLGLYAYSTQEAHFRTLNLLIFLGGVTADLVGRVRGCIIHLRA